MFRAAYRLFDSTFVLESDSPSVLARFDAAYGRFRQPEARPDPAALVYRVLLAGHPEAILDGRRVQAADAATLELYASNAILHDATARVRSHFLLHAAALRSPAGQGIILAGAAGLGKTTLTLALLKCGWGLLSDDVAALDRTSGQLDPFPRSLGVRLPGGRPGEKRLVPAEETALPCPARFLFVLGDPAASGAPDEPYYLSLDRVDEALIHDLGAVAGVSRARLARGGPYPVVRLDLACGALAGAEPEVEAVCRRHGALLFDLIQGHERPPDFGREPRLEPISTAEAGRELLAHLKGGRRSAVLHQAYGGSASRLYLALAGLVERMASFRLFVGRLEGMVDAIRLAAGQSPAEGSG